MNPAFKKYENQFKNDLLNYFKDCTCKINIYTDSDERIKTEWEESFASTITTQTKKDIHMHPSPSYGGMLWHIFSFQKVKCYEDLIANDFLDRELKKVSKIIIFFQDYDFILEMVDYEPKDIDILKLYFKKTQDVFVVDEDYTFTYVSTHEVHSFGPYYTNHKIINS